jgi:hypothetical protein
MLKELWNKVTMLIAIPFGLEFVVLAMFGQLCLDNFPYLVC